MVTGRKLLLADDSVTIQKVIDLTFGDEGMQVTTVSNGEQAILKLEEILPDIVLADIYMPGRTGYEVCEHIKRDERYRHIPVLLLVGSFEPFDEAEARRVGADDYLTKPFQSIRQLVSKVTSLLSGGGGGEDEATTRDLNMPKEAAEREREASRAGSDIYTADTAPLPQGGEAARLMESARRAGHESLDDGMIEARHAPDATAASFARDTTGAVDTRPTAPLSPSELAEAGIRMEPQQQRASNDMQETIRDFKIEEMSEESMTDEPQRGATANYMTRAQAADEALLDLGDIEPPPAVVEADDFILDLQDEPQPAPARLAAPPETTAAQHASTFAAPSSIEADAPSRGADSPSAAAEASFASEFEQGSLQQVAEPYDISHGSAEEAMQTGAKVAEETGVQSGMEEGAGPSAVRDAESYAAAPEEAAQEFAEPQVVSHGMTGEAYAERDETDAGAQPEAAAWGSAETESSGGASSDTQQARADTQQAQAGAITLDQLSPEAIDAIARRAVELLSTKVVEEVAWEVVPQLAELIIKRRLEEEKSEAK